MQETYVIPVQAFLPGPYVLPGMKYVLEGDTLVGDEMPLKVLDVDTRELEKKGLYDYKTVANPDKKFWDFIPDFGEFSERIRGYGGFSAAWLCLPQPLSA